MNSTTGASIELPTRRYLAQGSKIRRRSRSHHEEAGLLCFTIPSFIHIFDRLNTLRETSNTLYPHRHRRKPLRSTLLHLLLCTLHTLLQMSECASLWLRSRSAEGLQAARPSGLLRPSE